MTINDGIDILLATYVLFTRLDDDIYCDPFLVFILYWLCLFMNLMEALLFRWTWMLKLLKLNNLLRVCGWLEFM